MRFRSTMMAGFAATLLLQAGAGAQGEAGEQTYLAIELENVQITSYQLGVLDNQIAEALDAGGAKYTPAQVSAASRDALAKLKSQLRGRTGTTELVICVPPGSRQCIEIVCDFCSGE